jgi:cysteine sulfinate desulfinase/cysteine desulfurase-like protein
VLKAMGLSKEEAENCIRFSLSTYNTKEEMEGLVNSIFELYGIPLPSQVIIKKK